MPPFKRISVLVLILAFSSTAQASDAELFTYDYAAVMAEFEQLNVLESYLHSFDNDADIPEEISSQLSDMHEIEFFPMHAQGFGIDLDWTAFLLGLLLFSRWTLRSGFRYEPNPRWKTLLFNRYSGRNTELCRL